MQKTLAYSFTLACLSLFSFSAQAEVFRFTGESDREFTNPSNWSPSYPGIIIDESDMVIIESTADFDGPLLLVHGSLRIEHRATLNSPETHLQLAPGASMDNRGIVECLSLASQGALISHSWSHIYVDEMILSEGANSIMMPMSAVDIASAIKLEGRLDVKGALTVRGKFENFGHLFVLSGAVLTVPDGMTTPENQELFVHPEASIHIGQVESAMLPDLQSD